MKVLKQNMRLVLMSLMLLICGATFAQTQVVFEAGVDVGETNSSGLHHIDKSGITFGGTRCNLHSNPYDFQTFGGNITSQKLTVTSTVGNIQKIEITGNKLNIIDGQNVGTFNSSTGVWEGNSNNVELNIPYTSWRNKVTVSKVVVTLAPSVATTLSFDVEDTKNPFTVYRSKEKDFKGLVAKVTENKGNTEVADAAIKYTSNNPEVVSVDENTGALTYGETGEATITASYEGVEGVYDAAQSISYTVDYKKNPLTLAYSKSLDVIYNDDKDSYAMPSLSITSNDAAVKDIKVNYESSNNDAATVNEEGKITLVGVGEATITASVINDNLYDDATATYTVRVADPDNIFHESFDDVDGEGGNDGNWEINKGKDFDDSAEFWDNTGWTKKSATTFQDVTGGNKCMNIYGQAHLYSPELKYLNGNGLLIFRAGADKEATLTVTVSGKEAKFTVPAGEFKDFYMPINGTESTKIDFYGYWTAGGSITGTIYNIFIDDVKVVRAALINEITDNTADIEASAGKKNVNVLLDRKLSNEYWNTICFPFDLEQEQVNELFGENSELREFNRVENNEMVFVAPEEKDGITAGVPYLFKPENNIDGSLFFRAQVSNVTIPAVKSDANGNEYKFIGVTSPTELQSTDIFIGTDGNLYYPDMETEGKNIIKGMRAYIQLPEGTDAKTFVINANGTTTSINNAAAASKADGMIYTISGQYVGKDVKNLQKGVYIRNGKKFVVE